MQYPAFMKVEYRTLIDRAFASKANLVISNAKPDHATYTMAMFLDNAERVVRIYSSSLPLCQGPRNDRAGLRQRLRPRRRTFLPLQARHGPDDPHRRPSDVDDDGEHPLVRLAIDMQQQPDQLGGTLWIAKAPPARQPSTPTVATGR